MAEFSGLGDLTTEEVARIQETVERLQAEANNKLGIAPSDPDSRYIELSVVGSAARGQRRGAGTDLPVGHGPGTRSDIDYAASRGLEPFFNAAHPNSPFSVDQLPHLRLPDLDRMSGVFHGDIQPDAPHIVFRPGQPPEARGPVPDGPRPRPPRPGDDLPRTHVDGVDGARPDAGPEGRPTGGDGTARTTAGDAGGATGAGDCATCGAGGGSRQGAAGTAGDAGVQLPPPEPPPGARSAPGAPPPPADGAEAFARAQRIGGSEHNGVVYAAGGDPGDYQVYRFTPDGQYLGPADSRDLPRGHVDMAVSSQVIDMRNPGAIGPRFMTAPDGRVYALANGVSEVRPDGTMRALSPRERLALDPDFQKQLMLRAAGPTIAMPDGFNAGAVRPRPGGLPPGAGRALGQEVVGNHADAAEIHRGIQQAREGGRFDGGQPLRR